MTYAEKIVPLLASSLPSAIELKFLADSSKMNRFDLSIPRVANSVNRLMTALLTDGLIDADDVTEIMALTHDYVDWPTSIGIPNVQPYEIENAEQGRYL